MNQETEKVLFQRIMRLFNFIHFKLYDVQPIQGWDFFVTFPVGYTHGYQISTLFRVS